MQLFHKPSHPVLTLGLHFGSFPVTGPLAIFIFLLSFPLKTMAAGGGGICNPNGNLLVFANYDGGELNINIDVNIPNLKIGIVSYEAARINISGAFSNNVTEVIYAGFQGINNTCGPNIPTTTITGIAPANYSILTYPPVTLNNANGWSGGILCAYSCDLNTNQGGCNTIDQVLDYFNVNLGGTLYSLLVQYNCWVNSTTYDVSNLSGTCCTLPVVGPSADFTISNDTICVGDCVTLNDLSANNPTSWNWTFGNGTPASSGNQNPGTICYPTSGVFPITLSVSNANGSDSQSQNIVVLANPVAGISYPGSPYNGSISAAQAVNQTGVGGGSYSAVPAGLSIDPQTGSINPSLSNPGIYTVTYSISANGNCPALSVTTQVEITQPSGAVNCNPSGNVLIFTNYDGGELNINIDTNIANIKIGICSYEPVRVNIGGAFASNVTEVLYAGFNSVQNNNNCNTGLNVTSIQGVPSNLVTIQTIPPVSLNNANGYNFGIICAYSCDLSTWQGGCNTIDQIVDYFGGQLGGSLYSLTAQYCCWLSNDTYSLSGLNGACCLSSNPSATIDYPGSPFCSSINTAQNVVVIGSSIGSFSASPGGLSIDPNNGSIAPDLSNPGTYTVTYSMPGCPGSTATTTVVINNNPTATIAYAGPFGNNLSSPQNVNLTGSSGGTFTATPAGLIIDPSSGSITPSGSSPGTYTVTYSIAANPPCAAFSTTTQVTITAASNGVCNVNGNVMIYSNYEGGVLNIDVDQNIPNLKIGICTYEAVEVNFSGAFVSNITEVIYAGFNGTNNTNCGNTIATTVINGVPPNIVSIYSTTTNNIAPTTYLGEPVAPGSAPLVNCMTGADGCSNSNAGGANSSPQIVQYFLAEFGSGSQLFGHLTQYTCFSGTYALSVGGNCCLETPTTPPNLIYAGGSNYNFILPNDTLLCSGSITIDLSFYPVLFQPPTYPGYVWSDGTTGPIITITSPGTYSFTVGDYCHYGNNLLTDTLVVLPCCNQPPAPLVSSDTAYCQGAAVLPLTANAVNGGTISWYSDAALNNLVGTGNSFAPPPLVIGVNNFYATETNAGCEGPAAVVSLTLNANLTASINYNGNIFCQSSGNITPVISGTLGGSFSSIPSGLVINTSSGEIDVQQSIPNIYQVTYLANGLCAIPSTFQINIVATPKADFFYDSPYYCYPDTNPVAQLAPGATYGVFSSSPPGLFFADPSTGTINLTSSLEGTYVIRHIVPQTSTCPADTATFTIKYSFPPTANIRYDYPAYCAGLENIVFVNIIGDRYGTFDVTPSGLAFLDNIGTIDLWSSQPGNYSISYTIPGADACPTLIVYTNMEILESPVVTVSPTQTIKEGSSVEINAEGIGTFLWNTGDTLRNILVSPLETSLFCVTLSNNGCVDTACTKVIVELECGEIFIPSGFSPNGDGNNDNFKVRMNTKCLSSSLLRIYDRWGGLLFESPEINAGWDGTFKGELLANGVYTFTFEYKLLDSDFSEVKNGTVQLVR